MGWKKKEKRRKETKNQKDGWRLEDREGGGWSDIRVVSRLKVKGGVFVRSLRTPLTSEVISQTVCLCVCLYQ